MTASIGCARLRHYSVQNFPTRILFVQQLRRLSSQVGFILLIWWWLEAGFSFLPAMPSTDDITCPGFTAGSQPLPHCVQAL